MKNKTMLIFGMILLIFVVPALALKPYKHNDVKWKFDNDSMLVQDGVIVDSTLIQFTDENVTLAEARLFENKHKENKTIWEVLDNETYNISSSLIIVNDTIKFGYSFNVYGVPGDGDFDIDYIYETATFSYECKFRYEFFNEYFWCYDKQNRTDYNGTFQWRNESIFYWNETVPITKGKVLKKDKLEDYSLLLQINFSEGYLREENGAYIFKNKYVFSYNDLLENGFHIDASLNGSTLFLVLSKDWNASGVYKHSLVEVDPMFSDYDSSPPESPQSEPPSSGGGGWGSSQFIERLNISENMTLAPDSEDKAKINKWIFVIGIIVIILNWDVIKNWLR